MIKLIILIVLFRFGFRDIFERLRKYGVFGYIIFILEIIVLGLFMNLFLYQFSGIKKLINNELNYTNSASYYNNIIITLLLIFSILLFRGIIVMKANKKIDSEIF